MKSRFISWTVYSMIILSTIYYCLFSMSLLMDFLATFNLAY
jgi:hypothetical protein